MHTSLTIPKSLRKKIEKLKEENLLNSLKETIEMSAEVFGQFLSNLSAEERIEVVKKLRKGRFRIQDYFTAEKNTAENKAERREEKKTPAGEERDEKGLKFKL